MQENEIARRRDVALEAAWAAAALCAAAAGGTRHAQRKGHLDLVTETDGAVERDIVERLRAAFPDDRVVGEESADGTGLASLRRPGLCWLLDPICGTDNFAAGFSALYCNNIALLRDGVVIMAVVTEGPRPDEALCAVRGEGAWAIDRAGNRRALRVSAESDIVAFDLGYLPSWGRPERAARIAGELIRRNRFALRLISSSITLAEQARGALCGNVLEEAKPWDMAAGALLLSEAGAAVADLAGQPWAIDGIGLISGSTPDIHAELVASVAQALGPDPLVPDSSHA